MDKKIKNTGSMIGVGTALGAALSWRKPQNKNEI